VFVSMVVICAVIMLAVIIIAVIVFVIVTDSEKSFVLSVISLSLLRTKKTHTGAVSTGLLMGVGDHRSYFGARRRFGYQSSVVLLGVWLLVFAD